MRDYLSYPSCSLRNSFIDSFLSCFQLFCDDVNPSEIFSCLRMNKNDPNMEDGYVLKSLLLESSKKIFSFSFWAVLSCSILLWLARLWMNLGLELVCKMKLMWSLFKCKWHSPPVLLSMSLHFELVPVLCREYDSDPVVWQFKWSYWADFAFLTGSVR